MSGPPRRRSLPSWSCRIGAEQRQHLRSLRGCPGHLRQPPTGEHTRPAWRPSGAAWRQFRPGAYLAAERERIGLLLDRATRALRARLAADRATLARSADRLPALVGARTALARATLTRSAAGLAALDPFATLERGYAIVRTPGRTRRGGCRLPVGRRSARGAPGTGRVGRVGGRRARLRHVTDMTGPAAQAGPQAAGGNGRSGDDVSGLLFDQALDELRGVVARLEEGGLPLEELHRPLRARRRAA